VVKVVAHEQKQPFLIHKYMLVRLVVCDQIYARFSDGRVPAVGNSTQFYPQHN
jgi:hypothetical protein